MYFRVKLINFSVLAKYHCKCTGFMFPLTGNVRCHKMMARKQNRQVLVYRRTGPLSLDTFRNKTTGKKI
jgi:hypothetical protein